MRDRSILIIDDEVDFLDSVRRGLIISGYRRVTVLAQPARIRELLAEACYDIVLIDVSMPQMSGLEVLKYIVDRCQSTVCFMLSAHDDTEIARRCLELGARDYLLKPISRENLLAVLQSA